MFIGFFLRIDNSLANFLIWKSSALLKKVQNTGEETVMKWNETIAQFFSAF